MLGLVSVYKKKKQICSLYSELIMQEAKKRKKEKKYNEGKKKKKYNDVTYD